MKSFDKATSVAIVNADFDLARSIDKKFRYSNIHFAFEATCELVVPIMKNLGTADALKIVLHALDPETPNAFKKDHVQMPPRGDVDLSLRKLVFPGPKFTENGCESNRQLARILNALSERDPIQQMRRPHTGEDVFHLPVHPMRKADEQRVLSREEMALEVKTKLTSNLMPVLQGHMFNKNEMSSTYWMLHTIDKLPTSLEGGEEVRDAVNKVLNDFYSVGRLIRVGYDIEDSVKIVKDELTSRRSNQTDIKLDTV